VTDHPDEHEGPIIRDRRRIDPVTGAVREQPAPGPDPTSVEEPAEQPGPADQPDPDTDAAGEPATDPLAERTADLQRVQAEYANYRRRVERDREAVRVMAVASVLNALLPVLDDIGRAREHGELEGAFKSVGEALEGIVEKLGLSRYGEPGDPFDPAVHEALTHTHSAEVTEPTAVQVFQPGYRIGERVIRPARVAVADPE
jgi:molecular chaperone GrpE